MQHSEHSGNVEWVQASRRIPGTDRQVLRHFLNILVFSQVQMLCGCIVNFSFKMYPFHLIFQVNELLDGGVICTSSAKTLMTS